MIEAAGGTVPFICHIFLILFGGFFGLNLTFNKKFVKNSVGYESADAAHMGRPLGFMMIALVLMFVATLFQVGNYNSANEIFTVLFLFLVMAAVYNFSLILKILPTHDGKPWPINNVFRPLLPLAILIIRYFTL